MARASCTWGVFSKVVVKTDTMGALQGKHPGSAVRHYRSSQAQNTVILNLTSCSCDAASRNAQFAQRFAENLLSVQVS